MTNRARDRRLAVFLAILAAAMSGTIGLRAGQQAQLSGQVVTRAEPSGPLARVLVTVKGEALSVSRTVITDTEGRFAFDALPAGTYTVTASRPPFITTEFGAKRPARAGTPIAVAAGQQVSGLVIPLALGAAVTGMVRDAAGQPAPGVTLEVVPLDTRAALRGVPIATDDRGVYRTFGFPPGRYVVTARVDDVDDVTALGQMSDDEMDRILAELARRPAGGVAAGSAPVSGGPPGAAAAPPTAEPAAAVGYAPIHYPGTPDLGQAVAVELAEGEERAGIDIDLQLVRLARVEGRLHATDVLPSSTYVTMTRLGLPEAMRPVRTMSSARPDEAGRFSFGSVVPGQYQVVARAASADGVAWALSEIFVGEGGVPDVVLTLEPGLELSGRVAFDGPPLTAGIARAPVSLQLVETTGSVTATPSARVQPDGTFAMRGILPGTYVVAAASAPDGWWLRSVTVGGRDVLDAPLDIGLSGNVRDVVATFTDRASGVSGTLQLAPGVPATDYFVVVFPAEQAWWRPGARRVQMAGPRTDGGFAFRNLPGGRYLIAALTDLEPADLNDPLFLERLVPAAVAVQVADGEMTLQDLRIGG